MEQALVNDIVQWDVKAWSQALHYWEQHTDWSRINNALELGSRQGGLSLWLALKGKEVTCTDQNRSREKAESLHNRYKLSDKIQYVDVNATDIPFENEFDLVVFKSLIGSVGINNNFEAQQQAFEQMYRALKPGGTLLFAENLVASPIHRALRKRFLKWGEMWRYVTLSEMHGFLKPFSHSEIKCSGFLGTFGRNEQQRNALAAFDHNVANHLVPNSWKYFAYGMAVK